MAKTIESQKSLTARPRFWELDREASGKRRFVLIGSLVATGLAAAVLSVMVVGSRDGAVEAGVNPSPSVEATSRTAVPSQALTSAQLADAARWTAIAQATGGALTSAQLADAARWTAIADAYRASGGE